MLSNRFSSKRTNLALGATHAAVGVLARLPDSDEKRRLLVEAEACRRHIQDWSDQSPTPEAREAVMKRVLALHLSVTALRRSATASAVRAEDEADDAERGGPVE